MLAHLHLIASCSCTHVWPVRGATHHAAGTFNSGMPWLVDTLRHAVYGKHRSTLADASARAHPRCQALLCSAHLLFQVLCILVASQLRVAWQTQLG